MSKQGYLGLKSATSVMGRHRWLSRYVVILPRSAEMAIYDSHESVHEQLGRVPFAHISSVQVLPEKKNGRRFNVAIVGGKPVALLAETPEEADAWVNAVRDAYEAHRADERKAKADAAAAAAAANDADAAAADDDAAAAAAAATDDAKGDDADAAETAGHLVRMNASSAVKESTLSLLSSASADGPVPETTPIYASLVGTQLTVFDGPERAKTVGFVSAANIERVEAFKMPAPEVSADADILQAPNKAEGVRLFLEEEDQVWEFAVPENEELAAADWVSAITAARDAAAKDEAAGAPSAAVAGAGAGAGADGARRGSAGNASYHDIELSDDEAAAAKTAGGADETDPNGTDLRENPQEDPKRCCVVM